MGIKTVWVAQTILAFHILLPGLILRVASQFFPGILLSSKTTKNMGNSWFSKRTMVEKNGESTPRFQNRVIPSKDLPRGDLLFGSPRTKNGCQKPPSVFLKWVGKPHTLHGEFRHLFVCAWAFDRLKRNAELQCQHAIWKAKRKCENWARLRPPAQANLWKGKLWKPKDVEAVLVV